VATLTTPAISAVSGGLATMAGALLIRLVFPAVAGYRERDATAPSTVSTSM
jgi:hypothetical protein